MVKIKTQQNLATFVSFKFSNTFSLNLFSLLLTKSVIFPLFSLFSENFNKNSGTLIYDRSHLADNQTIFKNNPLKYVTDA